MFELHTYIKAFFTGATLEEPLATYESLSEAQGAMRGLRGQLVDSGHFHVEDESEFEVMLVNSERVIILTIRKSD